MSKKELIVSSPDAMHALGKRIGGAVFPGAFIALYGDLGAGKTTLTKGIAEALGIVGILSPTFTIVRHHEGRLALDHFDAYRIEDPDELYAIGYEDHLSSGSVVIMEWCENVPDALPKDRLEIKIVGSGQDPRRVLIRTRGSGYEGILEAV